MMARFKCFLDPLSPYQKKNTPQAKLSGSAPVNLKEPTRVIKFTSFRNTCILHAWKYKTSV